MHVGEASDNIPLMHRGSGRRHAKQIDPCDTIVLKGTTEVMKVKTVDAACFDIEIRQADVPVLALFSADWCSPCAQLNPSLERLGSVSGKQMKVVKIDVVASPEIASSYGVASLPTLAILKNGAVADIKVGTYPFAVLAAWCDRVIG